MRAWGGNLSPGAGNQRCPAASKSSHGGKSGGAMWSMSSLTEVLPRSPSPICSSTNTSTPRTSSVATTTADFCTASHISSEFFTPRDQNKGRDLLHFLRSDSDFNCSKESWKQQEGNSSTWRRSMSTLYESAYATTMEQQKLQYQELICDATTSSSGKETPTLEGHYRLTRPRPYREFLDEVQTRQQGAEFEAWKKAQQLKLQNKLRRKEAAITNWEREQKNKARAEVESVERKMERKREKALKKMQQKIVKANKAAEVKRDRERRAALKKMAKVAKFSEKIHTTKCVICLKLRNWC